MDRRPGGGERRLLREDGSAAGVAPAGWRLEPSRRGTLCRSGARFVPRRAVERLAWNVVPLWRAFRSAPAMVALPSNLMPLWRAFRSTRREPGVTSNVMPPAAAARTLPYPAAVDLRRRPPRAPRPRSALERGVEADLRAGQRLGDRAVVLGGLGRLAEAVLIHARHARARRELDALDREAVALLAEADLGVGDDGLGLVPGLAQHDGERHREAARVRGADELLGIAARAVLHARLVRVRALERARAQRHAAAALGDGAVPLGMGVACRHRSPPRSRS